VGLPARDQVRPDVALLGIDTRQLM
jgi:hypothetical protein